MLVYIASSFSLTERVDEVAKALDAAGHEITIRWWDRCFEVEGEGEVHTQILKTRYDALSPAEFYGKPTTDDAFLTDFLAVKSADALIWVAEDKPRKFNGAPVEYGIAVGDFKPCFLLGRLENSVMYAPLTPCEDVDQLLIALERHRIMMRGSPIHPVKEAVEE